MPAQDRAAGHVGVQRLHARVGTSEGEVRERAALESLPVGNAPEFSRKLGIVDLIGLHGGDAGGRGVRCGVPLATRRTLSHATRISLSRLAGHLAAAYRLVRVLERSAEEPAEVLNVDGKLLDARKHVEDDANRLRGAVREMDRARG